MTSSQLKTESARNSSLVYPNKFLAHLPFQDKVTKNANEELAEIKHNLFESILLNELRPGVVHWTNRLRTYLQEYGYHFSKADQISFIKIYLELIKTPSIDLAIIDLSFDILTQLLRKFEKISRDELVIDWRPIYEIYARINKINEISSVLAPENLEKETFVNFIYYARLYFSTESTNEMLQEWRPLLCPFDVSINAAFERFNLFLPTLQHDIDKEHGYNLWINEFLDIWFLYNGRVSWESNLISLIARLASDTVGQINWNPYINFIFSKLLRGFGLSIGDEETISNPSEASCTPGEALTLANEMSQAFSYSPEDIYSLSVLIVSMIGSCDPSDYGNLSNSNRNLCMIHIKKLFQLLRSYYHPSDSGPWVENFFALLKSLPDAFIYRIRNEKLGRSAAFTKEPKNGANTGASGGKASTHAIRDEDIDEFVKILKDIVLVSIFSKTNFNDAIKAFQYLCFLRPNIMVPIIIEKISASFEHTSEQHKYPPMLACLASVPREIVDLNHKTHHQNVRLKITILRLLHAVLPGIDVHDLNRFILTFQFLSNVIGFIVLVDCTPALAVRTDLSEYEKELCKETAKFDHFVNEFMDKLFTFIDYLSSDLASQGAQTNTITEENYSHSHVLQTLKVLVYQSSKKILQTIIKRLIERFKHSSFNARAGKILSIFCGYLVKSGISREAFKTFFDYAYENLIAFKNSKDYDGFLKSEQIEPVVAWNLQLLSQLLKTNGSVILEYMVKINELIKSYRRTINKECVNYISECLCQLITSMTYIYPKDSRSVNYSIVFDDEKEFFKEHFPIRDWGCLMDVSELKMSFHVPTANELTLAISFVNKEINKSRKFLSESILNSRAKSGSSSKPAVKYTKEDNYRELNYLYFLAYGASRLLKRPHKGRESIVQHINSSVSIGYDNLIDKGLGFELVNLVGEDYLKDANNVYNQLSEENRQVVLTMRLNLIEFVIKLANKLIETNTNDTVILILISRILSTLSINYGSLTEEFEKSWKTHFVLKATIKNKLMIKKYPRDELIRRVMLQYNYRSFYLYTRLNDLDLKIIDILFKLAVNSYYLVVREEARTQLFSVLSQYPYSAFTILDKLVDILNKSDQLTPEQLEGCLHLIKGNSNQTSLLIRQNWQIIGKIWPALFRCKHFEKESIQLLLDDIYSNTNENYDSFDNRIRLTESLVRFVYYYGGMNYKYKYPNEGQRLAVYHQKCKVENELIGKLMSDLIRIVREEKVIWKNQEITLFSLTFLLNSCEQNKRLLSKEFVRLFVDSLVHENKNLRKIATDGLCVVLKMVKYKKMSKRMLARELVDKQCRLVGLGKPDEIVINKPRPGYRDDNRWHLHYPNYLKNYVNTAEDREERLNDDVDDLIKWEKSCFLDKSYWGYYCWPPKIRVNLNKRKLYIYEDDDEEVCEFEGDTESNESASVMSTLQSSGGGGGGVAEDPNEEFKEPVRIVRDRFKNDAAFLRKYIELAVSSSSGEAKEEEKFDNKRFYLFKCLFRNFGSTGVVNGLFEHLTELISDKQEATREASNKLAAEMLAGLVRGSKYWNLTKLKELWTNLKPVLDLIIENITNETLGLWFSCFSEIAADQDPRRLAFYLNYFHETIQRTFEALKNLSENNDKQRSSVQISCCLYLLTAFNQLEWRVPSFWQSVFQFYLNNMSHPYKTIRETITSFLYFSTANDIDHSIAATVNAKHHHQTTTTTTTTAKFSRHHVASNMTLLNMLVDQIEAKLDKSIELFEQIGDVGQKNKAMQMSHLNEFISSLNFLQSVLDWLFSYESKALQPYNSEIARLVLLLCKSDKIASYDEACKIKLIMLRMFLAITCQDDKLSNDLVDNLQDTFDSDNWYCRLAAVQMLQNYGIFNTFIVNPTQKETIKEIVLDGLIDDNLHVRQASSSALTSLIHSYFINADDELISNFKKLSKIPIREKGNKSTMIIEDNLVKRHGAVLGLCSVVASSPYDVPTYLPDTVTYLCQFINDPAPIQGSVSRCLAVFKKTHADSWNEHKLHFSEAQLDTLNETLAAIEQSA